MDNKIKVMTGTYVFPEAKELIRDQERIGGMLKASLSLFTN